MIQVRKNGKLIVDAKDNPNYNPSYETEKDKPNTLYVNNTESEGRLSNEDFS